MTTARSFLRSHREALRIDDPDRELSLERRHHDQLGRRHLRFAQRYRGLPVWPAELIVHLDPDGNVDLLDGAFVPSPRSIALEPIIDANEARQRARQVTSLDPMLWSPADAVDPTGRSART